MNSRDKLKNVHLPLKSLEEEVQDPHRGRVPQIVKFQIIYPMQLILMYHSQQKRDKTSINRSNWKDFRSQEKKKNEKQPCSLEENRR